ncbi:hypothetical protein BU17DRAFT_97498 [Hysterangium stoloniferum]|nr:hypothetical protein BU17DRAFT_97498 [Hysterangium stoloniferum]
MRFSSAILVSAGLLTSVPAIFAAISINSPSPSDFWVQFHQNVISWQFASGDPNPVNIVISNPNSSYLNGPYAIANSLDVSNGTFTVTNVTLTVNSGYVVNFVNPQNTSQIFAQSQPFDVKVSTTTPANVSATAASPSPTSPAVPSPSNATASGSAVSSSPSASSATARGFDGSLLPVLGMTAVMALFGAVVTL